MTRAEFGWLLLSALILIALCIPLWLAASVQP